MAPVFRARHCLTLSSLRTMPWVTLSLKALHTSSFTPYHVTCSSHPGLVSHHCVHRLSFILFLLCDSSYLNVCHLRIHNFDFVQYFMQQFFCTYLISFRFWHSYESVTALLRLINPSYPWNTNNDSHRAFLERLSRPKSVLQSLREFSFPSLSPNNLLIFIATWNQAIPRIVYSFLFYTTSNVNVFGSTDGMKYFFPCISIKCFIVVVILPSFSTTYSSVHPSAGLGLFTYFMVVAELKFR